ncbi:MAG: hypothetical protein ACFCU1_08785 [Sumerlaeia bacterium]
MQLSAISISTFSFCTLLQSVAYSQTVIHTLNSESDNLQLLPAKEFYRFESPLQIDQPDTLPQPAAEVELNQNLTVRWSTTAGFLKPQSMTIIDWYPDPENALATIANMQSQNAGEFTTRSVRVLVPSLYNAFGDGVLNGYVVGLYPNQRSENAPSPVLRNTDSYAPPAEFYPLDSTTSSLAVTPYKTLGELSPPPMPGSESRYIAVTPQSLEFLKHLETMLQEKGAKPQSIKILRGYISPQERMRMERLGIQLAEFTRFQYGDAFALIIDENDDFKFDDLNADGTVDLADVEVFSAQVKQLMVEKGFAGGLGLCAEFEGPDHLGTPYLHLDLRGWNLTWREE